MRRVAWHDMVWHGMPWFGVVRYGMVWYDELYPVNVEMVELHVDEVDRLLVHDLKNRQPVPHQTSWIKRTAHHHLDSRCVLPGAKYFVGDGGKYVPNLNLNTFKPH